MHLIKSILYTCLLFAHFSTIAVLLNKIVNGQLFVSASYNAFESKSYKFCSADISLDTFESMIMRNVHASNWAARKRSEEGCVLMAGVLLQLEKSFPNSEFDWISSIKYQTKCNSNLVWRISTRHNYPPMNSLKMWLFKFFS